MKTTIIMLVAILALAASANAANLLLNPGFEAGFAQDADNWTKYGAAGREGWANHTGDQGMALYGWNGPGSGGGFYQDVVATAGTTYTLSAWYLNDQAAATSTFSASIEWLDSLMVLISATSQAITVPPVGNTTWLQQSFSGVAPLGTATARVVWNSAINTTTNETMKIDDVSFVPEPATMALLALGGLMLRRKK